MTLIQRIARGLARRTGLHRLWPARPSTRVFDEIYRQNLWGGEGGQFFSGFGSHKPELVQPYVDAVLSHLRSLPARPDVVDLGCGDFNVGRRIRPACGRYVACDVVDALVVHNRATFAALEVEFVTLDLVNDELPPGDIAFLRQVLQHLSNAQIARVVPKLAKFRQLVVTEHLPLADGFKPNVDKPPGADIRLTQRPPSGVVLTEGPFHLMPLEERVLCEVPSFGGLIRTTLYTMK